MSNLLVNTRDQQFVLYEHLGVENLFKSGKYADYSKETVDRNCAGIDPAIKLKINRTNTAKLYGLIAG